MQAVWTQAFPSSPPHCPLSAQACPPAASHTLPSYLPWFWLLPGISSFSPSSCRATFGDTAQSDPFPYLDLTLNPDLGLSVSRAQGHMENFTGDWLLALSILPATILCTLPPHSRSLSCLRNSGKSSPKILSCTALCKKYIHVGRVVPSHPPDPGTDSWGANEVGEAQLRFPKRGALCSLVHLRATQITPVGLQTGHRQASPNPRHTVSSPMKYCLSLHTDSLLQPWNSVCEQRLRAMLCTHNCIWPLTHTHAFSR